MEGDMNERLEGYTRFLDTSGSHLTYAALSVYRNFPEELSAKEREFLRRHLEACTDCAARLREVDETEGAAERPRVRKNAVRYAAAAAMVLALGAAVYRALLPTAEVPMPPAAEIAQAEPEPDPARFTPNGTLENIVERTVRSGEAVSIVVPKNGDTVAVPFTVRWKGTAPEGTAEVTVVDNANTKVWSGEARSRSATVDARLAPGLYYIKVTVGERLAGAWKVVVR